MKQLGIFTKNEKPLACAFTGHRTLDKDFSEKKLRKQIEGLIKRGVSVFYNGFALGFDMLAAEIVLTFKRKTYPALKLIACIPCKEQERYFSKEDALRYRQLLSEADEVVLLSEHYYRGCMLVRNRYMVEHADILLAYCNKEEGGTAYTVRYFQKTKPEGELLFV